MSDILFSAGYYFSQVFPCKLFSLRNQSAGYFFLKSPLTPSKVKWLAPKIHQIFAQLTDTDLSIISKAFWNNRGQDSLAKGEGRNFLLLTPTQRVHTDVVDVITKFSQMDSLPNFLSYGATAAWRLCYNLQCTMLYPVLLYFNFVLWVQDTMYNYEWGLLRHLPVIHCLYGSDMNISSNLWNIRDLFGCLYFVFKYT